MQFQHVIVLSGLKVMLFWMSPSFYVDISYNLLILNTTMKSTESPLRFGGIYNYFEGATINNLFINENMSNTQEGQDTKNNEEHDNNGMPSPDVIAKAILKVQNLFWGNSSYAIPYCVFRDRYQYHGNRSQYEREIEMLPFTSRPQYSCTPGVVSSTINDNKYMELPIEKWKANHAPQRVISLLDGFTKALDEAREEE